MTQDELIAELAATLREHAEAAWDDHGISRAAYRHLLIAAGTLEGQQKELDRRQDMIVDLQDRLRQEGS